MSRLRALLVVGLLIAVAATSAASGHGGQPVVSRTSPLLNQTSIDYVDPIPGPHGGWSWLEPVERAIVKASLVDLAYLQYEKRDDLGGFVPAPNGWLALGTEGKNTGQTIVGAGGKSQIVLYSKNGQSGSKDKSYTPLHGLAKGVVGGPTNCVKCGGILIQPPSNLFSNTGAPPANNCFSGCSTGGGTTKPGKHHHGKGGGGGGNGHGNGGTGGGGIGSRSDCGTKGLAIFSNLKNCRIYVVNQAPGDGTFEQDTIINSSKVPYVLSIKATGPQNRLWGDLEMGIWKHTQPAPSTMPSLADWTRGYTKLATLRPGQKIHLVIELFLPEFAGNADQHLAAIVAFNWRAIAINGR